MADSGDAFVLLTPDDDSRFDVLPDKEKIVYPDGNTPKCIECSCGTVRQGACWLCLNCGTTTGCG